MGNLLWGHYKEKIPLSLLSVQCIFTNAAICTWRQGSHTGWPELFKKDTEVQSAGNQSTEPFSFKFWAENIWPVNQYGRLLTWLQNWITKPTLEHLAPLTTWTAAQSKYSSLFERHSKCFLQLGHFFCLIDSYFAGPTFWSGAIVSRRRSFMGQLSKYCGKSPTLPHLTKNIFKTYSYLFTLLYD